MQWSAHGIAVRAALQEPSREDGLLDERGPGLHTCPYGLVYLAPEEKQSCALCRAFFDTTLTKISDIACDDEQSRIMM